MESEAATPAAPFASIIWSRFNGSAALAHSTLSRCPKGDWLPVKFI